MRSLSTTQMQRIDRLAVERYGIPVLLLMENAGRAVAEAVRLHAPRPIRVIVLCGSGNNGGDGVVAARYLHHWGYRAQVWWMKNPSLWSGDIGQHYRMAKAQGVRFHAFQEMTASRLRRADVLIDALLGTGTHGEIQGAYRTAIEAIHRAHRSVVAVDIPSGLDADTGKPLGIAVRAKITVTMAAAKKGLMQASARPYVGRLIVADIGIPKPLFPQ